MAVTQSQRALIERLFASLPDLQHSWDDHKVLLANRIEEEERKHRKAARHGAKWGMPVDLTVKFFAVRLLHNFSTGKKLPTLTDVLRWKASSYHAAAISQEFADKLKPWAESVPPEFADLDYCDLVS